MTRRPPAASRAAPGCSRSTALAVLLAFASAPPVRSPLQERRLRARAPAARQHQPTDEDHHPERTAAVALAAATTAGAIVIARPTHGIEAAEATRAVADHA